MSLIKLQGNASGTGAFTIAAPNGNTDRTLTLPDATGTMYNQGNIVGTVSQSGGVPTGRVIETGSNANGTFVKYADGTMFCYFTTPAVTNPFATAFGDVLRSWPATFISTPKAFVTQATQHGDINAGAAAMTANYSPSSLSLTSTTYRVGYRVGLSGGYDVSADVVAIGRWF